MESKSTRKSAECQDSISVTSSVYTETCMWMEYKQKHLILICLANIKTRAITTQFRRKANSEKKAEMGAVKRYVDRKVQEFFRQRSSIVKSFLSIEKHVDEVSSNRTIIG